MHTYIQCGILAQKSMRLKKSLTSAVDKRTAAAAAAGSKKGRRSASASLSVGRKAVGLLLEGSKKHRVPLSECNSALAVAPSELICTGVQDLLKVYR